MKSRYLLTAAFMAAMLGSSCRSVDETPQNLTEESGHSVTFTLRTPGSEKVIYASRALHDEEEYAIRSLTMYEYEVADDGTTTLARIMKKDGNGSNAISMVPNADKSYTFSIIVPMDNDGKKYTYKFVANDAVTDPIAGSSFSTFEPVSATLTLGDGQTADIFAQDGIAMSGTAKCDGSDIITMKKGLQCEVNLQRIVSRIDISYETPNLRVTSATLSGAPEKGTLFSLPSIPSPETIQTHNLAMNVACPLPEDFLDQLEVEKIEMKKAFYLYERQNLEDSYVSVHIEYVVRANGRDDYMGSVDVPFRSTTDGTFIHTQRNHLYTIVLGNGKDPVSGKVTATVNVNDWSQKDIDEPLTDDDAVVEN